MVEAIPLPAGHESRGEDEADENTRSEDEGVGVVPHWVDSLEVKGYNVVIIGGPGPSDIPLTGQFGP